VLVAKNTGEMAFNQVCSDKLVSFPDDFSLSSLAARNWLHGLSNIPLVLNI